LEQAANRKLEKERKQEYQREMEINQFKQAASKRMEKQKKTRVSTSNRNKSA